MNRGIAKGPRPRMLQAATLLSILSFAAALFSSASPARAAQGPAVTQPLTKIKVRVGTYNPFEIAGRLEVTRYAGDGELESVTLDLPELPGLRDQRYDLRSVLAAGQVTPPLEYPRGNPLKLFAFGLDSRFDLAHGGWAFITFRTYENGCRRLDFQALPDMAGQMRAWLQLGGRSYNVVSLDITTTMPREVTVQDVTVSLGGGSARSIPLALLPSARCP